MARTFRALAAATGIAAVALSGLAAAPTSDTTAVSVDGTSITVDGTLADGLGVTMIGNDVLGDAVASGIGVDVTDYSVSFPEAGKVSFNVTLGDANPVTGYFPQGTTVEITPTIGTDAMELTAVATLDGGLEFGAQSCAVDETGVNQCSTTPIDGGYADGVLSFIVDTSATSATINGGVVHVNYHVGTGVSGGVTFVNGIIDDASINAFASIPTATLLLDGAAAASATLSDAGYSVTATDLAAGDYAASMTLCGGAADFGGTQTECTTVDLGMVTVAG